MAVIGTVRCGAGGFGIATNEAHVVHMQCEYVEPTPEQLAAAAAEEKVMRPPARLRRIIFGAR
jgi:hypothetical protein